MKKKLLIFLMVLFILPLKVFASGGFSVSSSNVSMYPGETKTISINSNNAVGKLNISSSNNGVASVNASSIFIQNPGSSESITITSKSVGTATISVVASSNFATMDEEILAGQTRNITVNVIAKQESQSQTSQSNNNNNNNRNNVSTTKNNENGKSSNNNLREITVDGYELKKIDNNSYSLSVSNSVTSVNVTAVAEDAKAQISGTGSHELKIGENKIEIIITAENGNQNKVIININRKDGYYLDDLKEVIENSKIKDKNIIINKDSKLSKEQIKVIKDCKQKITFNYYDENKILRYSWIIDGSKIKDEKEFSFKILDNSSNIKKIKKLSNYADGIFFKFDNKKIPLGTILKIFVGDKYNENDLLNIYKYNNNKLSLIAEKTKVKSNYIEFNVKDGSELFITMSNIETSHIKNKSINIFLIIAIVESLVILSLGFVLIKRKNKILSY